jgi:hypothetical protein
LLKQAGFLPLLSSAARRDVDMSRAVDFELGGVSIELYQDRH